MRFFPFRLCIIQRKQGWLLVTKINHAIFVWKSIITTRTSERVSLIVLEFNSFTRKIWDPTTLEFWRSVSPTPIIWPFLRWRKISYSKGTATTFVRKRYILVYLVVVNKQCSSIDSRVRCFTFFSIYLKGIQPSGISIVVSQLHTHLAGRKIWTSHYRDGVELPEISRDDHYSTWFEELRQIYPPVKVFPVTYILCFVDSTYKLNLLFKQNLFLYFQGDSLTTTCSYDTFHRNNVTLGGDGILEEMCVNYLHYYPASRLEVCKSSVSLTSLMEYFLSENLWVRFQLSLY